MSCAPRSLRLDVDQKVLHAQLTSNPYCSSISAKIGKHLGATLPTLESQPKNTNALGSSKGSVCRTTPTLETAGASVDFAMRYLVKARVRSGRAAALAKAIADGTLGRGSITGDEYLYNMETARVDAKGEAHWVETCFCDPPLAEERPYWEEYFDLLSVKDAHSRRNCRHENGTEPWACCDCDCTKRLEEKLARAGGSFLANLRAR